MKSQKQLKDLKKEIIENSAVNIGYYPNILQNLPNYALIEAVKTISSNGWINEKTPDTEAENMLITESVKAMNFQDFKEISKYFFQTN